MDCLFLSFVYERDNRHIRHWNWYKFTKCVFNDWTFLNDMSFWVPEQSNFLPLWKKTIVPLFILSKFEFEEMSQSIVKCSFVFANLERVLVASPLRNLYFVPFVPIFTDKIMKNYLFRGIFARFSLSLRFQRRKWPRLAYFKKIKRPWINVSL